MSGNPKRRKLWLLIPVLIAAGVGVFFHFRQPAEKKQEKTASAKSPDRIYPVKRGDMTIGIMLRGSVNAKVKHKLALEAPFNTKLVKIVDENAKVKKGDVVAEFETAELLLKVEDYKLTIEQTKKDLAIALEEREVLKSTNREDLRTALDKVTQCQDDYQRYIRLEGPRDKDTQTLAVDDAERALSEAQTAYTTAKEDYDGTIFSDSDAEATAKAAVEKAQKNVTSAETKLNSALLAKKLFKRYTYPNKLKDLRNKLAQAKLGYEKTRVRTQSLLTQKNNQIYRLEITIRNNERQFALHSSWIPMMQLIAPVDGIVTYGDPDRIWGNPEVEVGMDGRRKQVIITIPDMSQMIVDVNLPEQYRSKVSIGDKVYITPESIQQVKIEGRIESIAALPVHTIPWDKSTPKIYRTVVVFDGQDSRIVSGMSVQVEVVSRTLHNVISIPIEAVFEEGGQLLVYRKALSGPEKVHVKIGASSDNAVEIKEGLKEGDEVFLYRPFQSKSS
ncbi:MAG: HlyD family efflux transporter periplasmic adaptor subunit [Lentisphaeria bacterium]|nr:HlyD family efflux transporter periplasmic adaptor subunit [Lentisphaeria bacterium]